MAALMFHGKIDTIDRGAGKLTIGGPLYWDGNEGTEWAKAITIVAVFAGQSGPPPIVASAFMYTEVTEDHDEGARWMVDLESDDTTWDVAEHMAASVLASITRRADPAAEPWRECWNWAGRKV